MKYEDPNNCERTPQVLAMEEYLKKLKCRDWEYAAEDFCSMVQAGLNPSEIVSQAQEDYELKFNGMDQVNEFLNS